MLVFIDESGDTGLKTAAGSSRYFVVALILFEEHEEAAACDQRIQLLKHELKFPHEFKFNKLRRDHRQAFFEAIQPYSFFYFGIAINKANLFGPAFKVKESFYKYSCSLVFENAKPYLRHAIVVIDGSGSRDFKRQLRSYLIRKAGSDIIKKVRVEASHNNNLIQLADMVVGAIHRSLGEKPDRLAYRKMISAKEMRVQEWPK